MKFNNRNVWIGKNVHIGENVKIGDNSTIYDNVVIGDNTIVSNDCVIGEPTQAYYLSDNYQNDVTVIGSYSLVRSHNIIYSGVRTGSYFSTGHRVTIREQTIIGDHCRIGTISDIQGHCSIGNYCWLHSNVHIGQKSKLGNFVFVYPYVVFTNDPTPPSDICIGPNVGDYSQIAVFSVLLPGVKIGRHCLIGAGSIVGKDVDDFQLALGSPATVRKDVREIKSRTTGESHYPWPHRFDRGMPWQGTDYAEWLNTTEQE